VQRKNLVGYCVFIENQCPGEILEKKVLGEFEDPFLKGFSLVLLVHVSLKIKHLLGMLRSYNPAILSLQALPALIGWPELYWWVGRRSRAVATADPPGEEGN